MGSGWGQAPLRSYVLRCLHTEVSPLMTFADLPRLSHLTVQKDRHRNTPKSAHNRSESLCAGLRVPCRIVWAWFGPALGPNPVRNRRFPAGSFRDFGACLAQPRFLCRAYFVTCTFLAGVSAQLRKALPIFRSRSAWCAAGLKSMTQRTA
jgi:hypothetical protein